MEEVAGDKKEGVLSGPPDIEAILSTLSKEELEELVLANLALLTESAVKDLSTGNPTLKILLTRYHGECKTAQGNYTGEMINGTPNGQGTLIRHPSTTSKVYTLRGTFDTSLTCTGTKSQGTRISTGEYTGHTHTGLHRADCTQAGLLYEHSAVRGVPRGPLRMNILQTGMYSMGVQSTPEVIDNPITVNKNRNKIRLQRYADRRAYLGMVREFTRE